MAEDRPSDEERKPPGSDDGNHLEAGDINARDVVVGTKENHLHLHTCPRPASAIQTRHPKAYLRRLIHHCRNLPLQALEHQAEGCEELKLNHVFIDLETETTEPLIEADSEGDQRARAPSERRISAEEAVRRGSRIVFTGPPGGGKSSFVREMLARQAEVLLGVRKEPPAGLSGALLPILVELRDLAPALLDYRAKGRSEADRQRDLVEILLVHASHGREPKDSTAPEALREALEEGTCFLVLDGLDEVAMDLRKDVQEMVREGFETYSFEKTIVTCREHSYVGTAVLPGFGQYQIAPLDKERIRRFAYAWYQAAPLAAEGEKNPGEDLAARATSPDLIHMAENPMLLTTLALVHQEKQELPKKRTVLYHRAISILALKWQEKKGPNAGPPQRLAAALADEERLWRILEKLGYEAHKIRSASEQGESQGELQRAFLQSELEKKEHLGNVALAKAFLDYIDERAGLILGHGVPLDQRPNYTFAHASFQEYLAGRYLIGHPKRFAAYKQHAGLSDFWDEPAQWGAEDLLQRVEDEELFLALAQSLNPEDEPEELSAAFWRGIFWCGRMARTMGIDRIRAVGLNTFTDRLLRRLRTACTSSLAAKERIEAGRLLGSLGEPDPALTSADDMELCWVPPGRFFFSGAAKGKKEEGGFVDLDYGYWIGRFPVTQGQFEEFVAAGGYGTERYWPEAKAAEIWQAGEIVLEWASERRSEPWRRGEPFDLPNHPVMGVTWYEMLAFCRWLTEKALEKECIQKGSAFCLPSEMEWEMAARGGIEIPVSAKPVPLQSMLNKPTAKLVKNPQADRKYPWMGDETEDRGDFGGFSATSRPGIFPLGRSPVGCEEMAGNVWEWTRSLGDKGRRGEQADTKRMREELRAGSGKWRYACGGAYYTDSSTVGCSARDGLLPGNGYGSFGFRVVLLPFTLDSEGSEL